MPLGKLVPILFKFKSDAADVQRQMAALQAKAKSLQESATRIGKIGVGTFTAMSAAGAFLISKYREQEVAERKVEAAMRTANATRGVTLTYLKDIANRLQETTLVGDEAGLNILQFGVRLGITKENLESFAVSVADVAEATGRGSVDIAKQLRNYFSNLETAASGLRSLGVAVTKQEEEKLKALAKSGKEAEAQAFILQKLSGTYRGTAAAAAEGTGRWLQLWGHIGDAMEGVGQYLQEWLQPSLDRFTEWMGQNKGQTYGWAKAVGDTFNALIIGTYAGLRSIGEAWQWVKIKALEAADAAPFVDMTEEIAAARGELEMYNDETDRMVRGLVAAADEPHKPKVKTPDTRSPVASTKAGGSIAAVGGTEAAAVAAGKTVDPEALKLESDMMRMHLEGISKQKIDFYKRAEELRKRARDAEKIEDDEQKAAELENIRLHWETLRSDEAEHTEQLKEQRILEREEEIERKREAYLLEQEEKQAQKDAEIQSEIDEQAHKKEFFDSLLGIQSVFGAKSTGLSKALNVASKAMAIKKLVSEAPAKAQSAYNTTSEIFPFPLGPALGAIHAGLIIAGTASAASKARGAQKGGMVQGEYSNRDSQLIFAQPQEHLVPLGKSWEDVKRGIVLRDREQRASGKQMETPPPQRVEIDLVGDAGDMFTAAIAESRERGGA